MKKFIALIAVMALCLSGCHSMIDDGGRQLLIYASFKPIYALLSGIVSDVPLLKVECLTQPLYGCPRSYSLSDWDIAKLSLADAVFLGGRGLESFADSLEGADLAVVEVMGTLPLLGEDEEVPEGDDEASHFKGANPWAWLGVESAKGMCEAMAAAMIQLDPKYEDLYYANLEKMSQRLDELKTAMAGLIKADKPSVAIMHEGLKYLSDELGLEAVATVERESGEDMDEKAAIEAFEKIKASGADVALIEKQAPAKLVRNLKENGISVALIDTLCDCASADDYFDGMLANARAVSAAAREASVK